MADNIKVSVDGFEKALGGIISDFLEECKEDTEKALEESAKIAEEEVKKEPAGAGKYRSWKKYSNGWTVDRVMFATGPQFVIHNKNYRLVHLLEKGHVNVDGSRARAFPHVEPAADKAVKDLIRRLTNGV